MKTPKIKVVGGTGLNGYLTVNGVRVGRLVGHRSHGKHGVEADYGVRLDDGRVIAEGYSYYADLVRDLPLILAEQGVA